MTVRKLGVLPKVVTVAVELDELLVLRFLDFKDLSVGLDGLLFVPFLRLHDVEVFLLVPLRPDLVAIAVVSLGAARKKEHWLYITIFIF